MQIRGRLNPQLQLQMKPTEQATTQPTLLWTFYKRNSPNLRPHSNVGCPATFLPAPLGEHKSNKEGRPLYISPPCVPGLWMPPEL